MKTKKKSNPLLILVVLVWGAIGVRALLLLNPSPPDIEQQNDYVLTTNFKLNTEIDSFSIHTVNRDPFLGTMLKKEPVKAALKKHKPLQWKPILYQGTVKQSKTKAQIFILSIDGNQYLLKKGQTKDSITLAYGNKQSITVRYKNRLKSFTLKK